MKKHLCILVAVLVIASSGCMGFASETAESKGVNTNTTVIPNMAFTNKTIKLSLDEAVKKMTSDSPSKAVIDIHKQQAINAAEGHIDSVQSYNEMIKGGYMATGTKAIKEVEAYLVGYAKAQAEPNYQAELNKLNLETTTKYYQLKQAEDMERIATENYNLKVTLLSNTQKKKELGTVSNMEVLQAESALNTSKDELFKAQNDLKSAKMAFNTFMGFELMQGVSLTDNLKQVDLPSKTLETSIREALTNRNEIKAANHGVKYATLGMAPFKDYPPNSSKNLNAKTVLAEAEKALKDATAGIEMDVRNKYITVKQKYEAISTGQKNVANAKEALRLAQLQYDVGMATLTTVNDAQIALNRAEVGLSQNLLDYNLAVAEYNYASGVGTTTAPIN